MIDKIKLQAYVFEEENLYLSKLQLELNLESAKGNSLLNIDEKDF
jgi:hypothetical protein